MPSNRAASLPRFFAPDLDPKRGEVSLPPEEALHLLRVMRLAPGDLVSVFDGNGSEFIGRVARTDRRRADVALLGPVQGASEPRVAFSLIQAVLKSSSMEDVVRDATMIGAQAIQAVVTEHAAVKPSVVLRPDTLQRWRRVAVASAKQSRRARVPAIGLHQSISKWLATSSEKLKLLLVEPAAECDPVPLRMVFARETPESVALIVGPEGGWAPEEIRAALAAGCMAVRLGSLTLRADRVAIVALGALIAWWGE
jgi:16S rRNA (uracil1498-N3)-methyltransferase